jgi:hypothetical protein
MLHDSTNLTALDLQGCQMQNADAAFAAIATLPDLQSLCLAQILGLNWPAVQLSQLKSPSKLTSLSIQAWGYHAEHLSQLSALSNLQRLHLHGLPSEKVSGGLPSQLAKLTSLDLHWTVGCSTVAEQLQHLSSLTALQHLSVDCDDVEADGLSGMKCTPQLTSLAVHSFGFNFSIRSTQGWPCLTGLQSLVLSMATAEPQALGSLMQLRSLSLAVEMAGTVPLEMLLLEVSKLSLLTGRGLKALHPAEGNPPADAFTALTVSTSLRALKLTLPEMDFTWSCNLFKAGCMYPDLRQIEARGLPISGQQLQQLASCCPALEGLSFTA